MNLERLEIIAQWLEAGAPHKDGVEGFNMNYWNKERSCGSVCCIGGAVDQWFVEPSKRDNIVACGRASEIENIVRREESSAAEALGLDSHEAICLFFPTDLIDDLEYISPAWAARCIRHLMETGEVDWLGTQAA